MKLVTVSEMRAIEREGNLRGVSYDEMMERAGRGVAEIIDGVFGEIEKKKVLGLVGSGNNGGDTLIALEILAKHGWKVSACLLRARSKEDKLVERVKTAGGNVIHLGAGGRFSRLGKLLDDAGILLDGVLGTGIKLPLQPDLEEALAFIAHHPRRPFVIAVDCPSGVDCESGQASPVSIQADITICMEAVKAGLMKFPAFYFVGDLLVVDLDLPRDLEATKGLSDFVLSHGIVVDLLPMRSRGAHKGTFGVVMVAAGSLEFTGAALLAGKAAYLIGVGLVRMAVPAPLHAALAGHLPEAVWLLLPHTEGAIDETAAHVLSANFDKVSALLIGPGIGISDATEGFVRGVLEEFERRKRGKNQLPSVVLDADALKLVTKVHGWQDMLPANSILTPHPGEMSVLTGLSVEEIQADRLHIAKKYALQWGHVVILKGALSVVAAPDGQACIIPVATSALARAGTGDVLAGLVAGLCAQGLSSFDAACAGAWIHAQAGLAAAEHMEQTASVLAGDVLSAVPEAVADLYAS